MSVVTTKIQAPKERARGPNLRILFKKAEGAPFQEALKRADAKNLVIASSKRMTKALVETNEWIGIRKAFACWTGTFVGYAKPGEKLGKFIEFTDYADGEDMRYVFPVPEQYREEKNAILVAEHPNYTLIPDGDNRVVEASKVGCITQFPTKEESWHIGDEFYDIPTGNGVNPSDKKARCLWRVENWVGPVRRGNARALGENGQAIIVVCGQPCYSFGVLVESP